MRARNRARVASGRHAASAPGIRRSHHRPHGPPSRSRRHGSAGADLAAPSLEALPAIAGEAWATIQANDFAARAGVIADEIAATRPHLIGLQEVALFRLQSPDDLALGGTVPATDVAIDFLAVLLDSIAARDLDYDIAIVGRNTDVEVPAFTGATPVPFDDVRFTDRDVILVRDDVAAANAQGALFTARLPVDLGGEGPSFELVRGWQSVDVTVAGRSFRFVNTHLEVRPFAPIQLAQAQELLATLDASPLPVVLVGDINSAADGSQTATYDRFVSAGLDDLWSRFRPHDPGYTCCHAENLSETGSPLDQRIDVVFTRGFGAPDDHGTPFAGGAQLDILGEELTDRTSSGLWPSDHAGAIATLRLPSVLVAR